MKNIIELLYYGQINETERSDKPHSHIQPPDEEDKAYDLLFMRMTRVRVYGSTVCRS